MMGRNLRKVCAIIIVSFIINSSASGGDAMSKVVKKSVSVGKCSINTLRYENKGAKDILLLHGMSFQAKTWLDLGTLDKLGKAGYNVVAADMPGFGETEKCGTNPQNALKGLIEAEGLNRPVLVGPSMGGRISLNFALDNPDMVGGLVLIGCVSVEENKDRLNGIAVPTFIVWGDKDRIAPISNAHLLDKEVPDSRLLIIEGAPHPAYLGEPELWHSELIRFMDDKFK